MPRIDVHVVRLHRVLDLVDDGPARRLDTQHLGDLDDMIGSRHFPHDPFDACMSIEERGLPRPVTYLP